MQLERAEKWAVTCPFTEQEYIVQFWTTDQESMGKRRMAYAVWANSPTFPGSWNLMGHGSKFYSSIWRSCDGPEAARELMTFMIDAWCFEDQYPDEFVISRA